MDKELKLFYSSPPPQPSPIEGEGVFFPFYGFISIDDLVKSKISPPLVGADEGEWVDKPLKSFYLSPPP